jgi:hypothetical protein
LLFVIALTLAGCGTSSNSSQQSQSSTYNVHGNCVWNVGTHSYADVYPDDEPVAFLSATMRRRGSRAKTSLGARKNGFRT